MRTGIFMSLQRFFNEEKSGGVVLGMSIIVALIIANTPVSETYIHILEQKIGFLINGEPIFNFSIHHWINDGLMSLFFFVVGLELKRELIGGELSEIKNVILPVVAAIGGMVVPALIYFSLNAGSDAVKGWGIPMSTDIAFSLGVLFLSGSKIPSSIKVFLTTLAIVDDLGAVIVIALFYSAEISFIWLGIGLCVLIIMLIANKAGVKNLAFYAIAGIFGVWIAFLMSGVHATIAAVLVAMIIPADARISEDAFVSRAEILLQRFRKAEPNNVSTLEEKQVNILESITSHVHSAIPPLQRFEYVLHPVVTFFIIPVFALANAGISFTEMDLSSVFSSNVALGVCAGLLIGKPLGIVLSVLLVSKLFSVSRPDDFTVKRLVGVGFLASIGFTMSMFVATLAFPAHADYFLQAKIGILAASFIGGITGYQIIKKA